MKAEDLPERDLAKRPAWYRAVSRERTRATRLLGFHQSTDEGKVPRHRSSPVKGIALERKGRQRDGALCLCAVRGELNGIIQARRRRVGREVEVDGPCDQPAFAVGFPGAQLAGEKEGPSLPRIDRGHGGVGVERKHPTRRKHARRGGG